MLSLTKPLFLREAHAQIGQAFTAGLRREGYTTTANLVESVFNYTEKPGELAWKDTPPWLMWVAITLFYEDDATTELHSLGDESLLPFINQYKDMLRVAGFPNKKSAFGHGGRMAREYSLRWPIDDDHWGAITQGEWSDYGAVMDIFELG